jgi:valyl-tRNA synthetase
VFCDWYLELAKPLLQGEDGAAKDETRSTAAFALDHIYALLHPFMPFLTEELWGIKGFEGPARESPLALAPWPELGGLEDQAAEAEIGWVVDLVSEVRSVRSELNLPAGAEAPLVLVAAGADVEARVAVWGETTRKLARLSRISFASSAPGSSAQLIVRGTLAAIPLEGVVDFTAEKARLAKETAKLEGDVRKIEAKLANADFLARAPEEVVEENRERLDDLRARIEKLAAAAKRLG